MEIMAVLAAIVAALLIGPCVAVGAVIDAHRVRALAALLRSRLEATSASLGNALWREAEAERALDAAKRRIKDLEATEKWLEESRAFWREAFEGADAQATRLAKALMAEQELGTEYVAEILALREQSETLRGEVASLRKQRRFLVGQRDALALSARGLTADAEGAVVEIRSLRAGVERWMVEHASAARRLRAANSRVKALEGFIEEAYGPLDECEIGIKRICVWCETLDTAGGSACEVCDQPF